MQFRHVPADQQEEGAWLWGKGSEVAGSGASDTEVAGLPGQASVPPQPSCSRQG